MIATALNLRDNFHTPSVWNAFGFALGLHACMFIWDPTILRGGSLHTAPFLMQVQYQDRLPPAPVVKKPEPPPIVKKAKKAGISLANHAPAAIRPVKRVVKTVAPPAPRTRASLVKMPKFIPHASDDEMIVADARPRRLATATALRPAASPFTPAPKLKGKSRGVRMTDVHFELTERGGISGAGSGRVVAIPVGEERGETAAIASAPMLHDIPTGRRTSGHHYQAPLGNGVGELAGKNRTGYVGAIQVGEPSDEEVIAAGNGHGSTVGKGVEIGGPVGDRRILHRQVPEYPSWAEEKGISAIVKIFFTVRSDGSIRRTVRVVHSSGYTELDQAAKEALLSWRFSPTEARSSTDEAWGVITFRFTLA